MYADADADGYLVGYPLSAVDKYVTKLMFPSTIREKSPFEALLVRNNANVT